MSEPGYTPSVSASRGESLWEKAPGWRSLTIAASVLTLAALALPLLPAPETAPLHPAPVAQLAPAVATPPAVAQPQPVPAAPVAPAIPAPLPVQPARHAPLTSAPAEQQDSLANFPIGTIVVPSGVVTKVNRHARGNAGNNWPVTITVISPPAHGEVTTQFGIGPNRSGQGIRIGNGTNVYYQSESGYTGLDTFTYRRTSEDPTDPLSGNVYTMTIGVSNAAGGAGHE
jgi:hypothetical protein